MKVNVKDLFKLKNNRIIKVLWLVSDEYKGILLFPREQYAGE